MRKRIEYIDVVETLAIFLVVCCHNTALLGQSVLATAILQFYDNSCGSTLFYG